MLKLQSPLTGDENLRQKSCRKPLQPKNSPVTPMTQVQILKPKQEWIEFSVVKDSNKENHPIYTTTPTKSIIEPLDSSLAEELSAIKKKLERLRLDRERTEKMLKEREMVMDLQMKELEQRGEVQKRLEIQVDILYRLKELQSYSMIISPIRTLREKEHEKKTSGVQPEETRAEDSEESVGEDVMQSPSSSWGSENSISSQLDILYRLKELQSYSMIISPIRTLREKEHEKKTSGVQPEETRAEDSEESVGEDVMQSPSSSWGSENSISSQLVAVK